jgi:diaminopimelate epimerase
MAVAVVAASLYALPNPIQIRTCGGDLEIRLENAGVAMIGPARKVFSGVWIDTVFAKNATDSLR